jgi:hypothetical protein
MQLFSETMLSKDRKQRPLSEDTVVSGLVAPRADKPKRREQPQEVIAPERLPEVTATERPRLVDVLAG